MKQFFKKGDIVRLYSKPTVYTVASVGDIGRVQSVYEHSGIVRYIVYFPDHGVDQIIHQPHLTHVKE